MKYYSIIFVLVVVLAFAATFSVSLAQVIWTPDLGNPVLSPGSSGEWDDNSLAPLCVLFEDTLYRMWYGGHDGSIFHIGYATSTDGINWEKDTLNNPVLDVGPPGSWDDARVIIPSVLHHDTVYHMWYSGNDGTTSRIGYATSTDGINWEKDTINNPVLGVGPPGSWYEGGVSQPYVRFDGITYHMWFGGWDASDITSIGYATSTYGITWNVNADPVLVVGTGTWDSQHVEGPSVFFDGNTYHMCYTGRNIHSWWTWRIGYATSQNGINWVKDTINNPVLTPSAGRWDSQFVGYPRVILDSANSTFKMWYIGGAADWDGHIGYATAPVTGINVLNENFPNDYVLHQNYPNPFNPTTNIEFSIPKSEFVTLKIYNILGEEVNTLVSERLTFGKYKYEWDGRSLTSGVYLYRIQAGEFQQIKKMVLIK
jgi:predicted GH43/DUF377 family glycosyl hydrolase